MKYLAPVAEKISVEMINVLLASGEDPSCTSDNALPEVCELGEN